MLTIDNKVLKINSKWLNFPIYHVYTTGVNGSVSATPNSGITGTEVTLSNTPDPLYQFVRYDINGASLKNATQFDILYSDVSVTGVFEDRPIPANTIRVRTNNGQPPTSEYTCTYDTATLVPGTTDVYDVYKYDRNGSWEDLCAYCTNIVEVLGGNTSNIVSMHGMFRGCTNLTKTAYFDTSSVYNMISIYQNTAISDVPLYDTSNVRLMEHAFEGTNITTIPLLDTSNVSTMYMMFRNCTHLTTVPLLDMSYIGVTGEGSGIGYMFQNCSSLTSVPLFDTSNCRMFYGAFDGCTSLTSIPLLDISSGTNISRMFSGCTNLTSIPAFNPASVDYCQEMFLNCESVQSGAYEMYQRLSARVTNAQNYSACFKNCGNSSQIPTSWKQYYTP